MPSPPSRTSSIGITSIGLISSTEFASRGDMPILARQVGVGKYSRNSPKDNCSTDTRLTVTWARRKAPSDEAKFLARKSCIR